MANGKPFNRHAMTCACWNFPLGSTLRVHGKYNRVNCKPRSVVVMVTDRGPSKRLNRAIDLSEVAFRRLDNTDKGLIRVTIERIK